MKATTTMNKKANLLSAVFLLRICELSNLSISKSGQELDMACKDD